MKRRWKLRREYVPGAPLYARQRIVLRGVAVEPRTVIPADLLDKRKHKQLWFIGKADHAPRGPRLGGERPVVPPVPVAALTPVIAPPHAPVAPPPPKPAQRPHPRR